MMEASGTAARRRAIGPATDARTDSRELAAEAARCLVAGLFTDKLLPWLILALALAAYAALEWMRFLLDWDAFPKTATVLAVASVAAAAVMARRHLAGSAGAGAGEKSGGRLEDALTALADQGYHVFHGVPCGDFEIPHVAVGKAGIYAIETTSLEKPAGRRARVIIDRSGLTVPGSPPTQNLLARASAQAASLSKLIKETTSKNLRVRPVLLFPGWTVDQKCPRMTSDPWVLETKSFLKMIERGQPMLNQEQVGLASYQIWRACERD